MGLLGIAAKLGAPHGVNAYQVVVAQMSLTALIMAVVILVKHGWRGFRLTNLKLYVIRTTAGTIYFSAFYLSLKGIPITDALVLESTSPFFALIIASVMERKRLSKMTLSVLGVAFVGVCLILLHHSTQTIFNVYALLGLSTGVARAVGGLSTRALMQVEPVERILFYFPLGTLLIVAASFPWTWPSGSFADGWPYLLAIAILFVPLGLAWAFGNQMAPSYLVGALFYSAIIIAALGDNFIWNVNFTPRVIIGICLVIGAGLGLTVLEARGLGQGKAKPR